MARILVVEDELTVRELVRMHLETVGHTVVTAPDGAAGLAAAESGEVDLVIADAGMPHVDGLAMLGALRRSPLTRALPVIFLSALEDRESMRRAMNLGAEDFLSKPVTRQELLQAVDVHLTRFWNLRTPGGRRVTAGDAAASLPTIPLAISRPGPPLQPCRGTLLYVGIRDAAVLVQGLSAAGRREAAHLIQTGIAEPIVAQQGMLISSSAQRCLAFFAAGEQTDADHAARAARAALLVLFAATHLRTALNDRLANGVGDRLSMIAAIETGFIELGTQAGEVTAGGALIDDLAQVDDSLGSSWSVAMGAEALRLAADEFAVGRSAAIALASSPSPRTFFEVVGFNPSSPAASEFARVYAAVADAVKENHEIGGRTATGNPAGKDGSMRTGVSAGKLGGIEGYRVLHRLGEGGMSEVFLARHEETGERRVLKMVPIDQNEDLLQRFLQEYALIAQVRHQNVARIYEQGFGEHYAYIAMEHLSGGDLRARLNQPLPVAEAIRYLTQVALGLTAIHQHGIIHRDLKPENLMFRSDSLLVLADFGIAKQLSTELTRTRHGEVYGTPFYMSPEQSRGLVVDCRSDLYSLGVILYEMLTGVKPYSATRAEGVVYQHIHAPIPRLPQESASMQGIVDRLLAKKREERFESALELLRAIRDGGEPPRPTPPRGVRAIRRALRSE